MNNAFDILFEKADKLRIAVVGDVMLDIYWWGDVDRISPEAPVPVVSLRKKETRPGGAANVALNLRSLGANVHLYSVIGEDEDGRRLLDLCRDQNIHTDGVLQSKQRLTTTKSRIISRQQQMLRLDAEITDDLSDDDTHSFLQKLLASLEKDPPDILILEDYNKGVLSKPVIDKILEKCRQSGIDTCVDPKLKNFLNYRNVTIFKPNLKEVCEGLKISIPEVNEEALTAIHEKLKATLSHQTTFITLSEHGVFYRQGSEGGILPSHRRNISDVSGAGDTVIATAAVIWALSKDSRLMAEISNIAGGLVCEEVGVVAIEKAKLLSECKRLLSVQ